MSKKILNIIPHETNNQTLNDLATKIYSVGGIDITTNLQPKQNTLYPVPSFGEFISLESNQNLQSPNTFTNNLTELTETKLNLDKANAIYYAKFGSLLERVRVGLENIGLQFWAAIWSKKDLLGKIGNNILNVVYYPQDNTSTFDLQVNYFVNSFDIYFLDNLQFKFADDRTNPIRNLTRNYLNYNIIVNGIEYPILDYTPAKKASNDFLSIKVSGKPFDIGNNSIEFYIRPNRQAILDSYERLDDFESYLLNRDKNYISYFYGVRQVEGGARINYTLQLEFPMQDLYNIDMFSRNYEVYFTDLLEYAKNWDIDNGNLLARKLVPDNIQSLTLESETANFPSAEKLSKLLIVYGRMWDDLNAKIEGMKFFNTVTYNKKDNAPDNLLKNLATTVGWEFFNGVDLSADTWRELILNSAWLWKSKGTRNSVEFLLKFFGVPLEIVDYNEYVVQAGKPIDMGLLNQYYSLIDPQYSINNLPLNSNGFPKYPVQTDTDYFQMRGDVDNGWAYFAKWANLFPLGFTGTQVTYTQELIQSNLLFEQDWDGTGNTLSLSPVNSELGTGSCFNITGETITDPYPEIFLDDCGCPLPISDKSLKYCLTPKNLYSGCTNLILDVWYECTSASGATLHILPLGGYPPYTISGATDGQDVYSGETYNIIAYDSSGCSSELVEIYINCINPCLGVNIDVNLDYECVKDEFGNNTGQAIVNIQASGGTEPYLFIGVASGDVVNHGEIIQVEVVDSNGCSSGFIGTTIDCPPPNYQPCQDIILRASLETTNTELAPKTAKVNAVYNIEGLPFGVYVQQVTLETIGFGGDNVYVVGTPVQTTFTTMIGADTISLDFDPIEIPTNIKLTHKISVILTDGCEYEETYNLSVNPRYLGSVDYHNNTLSPL